MDLSLSTGLLQGEVLDLRWSDIGAADRTICYRDSKLDKRVTIPTTSKVRSVLEECRRLSKESEYVLPQRNGCRYTSEGFRAMFQRFMEKWGAEGNERFTFQDIHSKWERDRQSTGVNTEVQQLIARGSESPGVELKQWMTLSDTLVRASLARHFAALANYGGGLLIFGIRKDGTLDPNHPGDLSQFNNDEIAGIVDKYLTPAFHCEVSIVSPPDGSDPCVVVRVPSHGSVPICAKADGPQNARGKPQGISSGRYYIRVNGPKSEPIETPEQWAPLIRRCTLNERQLLLDSIASLLSPPPPSELQANPALPEANQVRPADKPSARKRIGQRRRQQRRDPKGVAR